LIVFLALLAVLAAGANYGWRYLQSYESTDDAQVDGPMNIVSPRISGTVTAVHVNENQIVEKGQLVVELDPRDFEVALEQAQANVAQAQAQVRAENPNIPIAATSTQTTILMAQSEIANAEAGVAAAERDHLADKAKLRDAEAMWLMAGSGRVAGISGGRLNPNIFKRPFAQEPTVSDAIQSHATRQDRTKAVLRR